MEIIYFVRQHLISSSEAKKKREVLILGNFFVFSNRSTFLTSNLWISVGSLTT